ncbi:E3 ubiquitin-protein ligase SspH2 [Candida tropicalis]
MASSPGRIEVFDYKLPPSLKSLTIRNSKIKKFIIDAPNLETLIIGGDLEGIVVDESKLVIPSSLKKLTLEDNKIEELAIALPESLEWLDLSSNKLKNLKNIPSGLTHLDLSNNKFGSTDEIITFPVNLKLLNLNSNPIHDDWISKSNLSNLMELKDLFLVEIKLSTLNIEYLPVSLVALDIHGGTISSIVEDFKNFVNLQELNISGNRLSEELKLSISSNPQFFSENLTYCVI